MSPTGDCPVCATPQVSRAFDIIEKGRKARVELCRRSFYKFFLEAWHVLEPSVELEESWHIKTLCDHFQWMIEQWSGKTTRVAQNLLINVPPGTLKSRIFSVCGPAWAWLHHPNMHFLCMSSTPGVAMRDADFNRELVTSDWYRNTFDIPWEIRSDSDARGLFRTTAKGLRQSQGLNAKVTGVRVDMIIFDDPNDVKDTSEVKLTQVANAYLAARNRLNDLRKSMRLCVMQRVHSLDLSAHLLEQGGWEHLCIPMELIDKCACGKDNCDTSLGKNDPRTELGEVLQPERNTPEVLAAELAGMGSLVYAGQMLQLPTQPGGALFKESDWRYYDELPRDKNRKILKCGRGVMSVDCTFGKGEPGKKLRDRVAIVVVFPYKVFRYVDYAWAGRTGIVGTMDKIKEIYKLYTDPTTGDPMIGKIVVEAKANGEAVIEMLSEAIAGIVPFIPQGDKMARANACVPTVEAHNIRLKREECWLDEFKNELGAFPNGANDDLVDAFTQAILTMVQSGSLAKLKMLCAM